MGRRFRRRSPGALSVLWAWGAMTSRPSCLLGAFVLSGGSPPGRIATGTRRPMTTRCTTRLRHPSMDSACFQHPQWQQKPQHQLHRQRQWRGGRQGSPRNEDWGRDDDDSSQQGRNENRDAQDDDDDYDDARIRMRRIDPDSTRGGRQLVKPPFDKDPAKAADGDHTDDDDDNNSKNADRRNGVLVLLTVPLAWGTFEPAVRFVYREVQDPIPPFVFSLLYYTVAAGTLTLLAVAASPHVSTNNSSTVTSAEDGSSAANAPSSDDLEWPVRGGLELGTYLFVGNALQLLGLQTIASDRAAFLLQLTTVFVPLVEAAAVQSWKAVSYRVWAACLLALLGVFVMGLDGGGGDGDGDDLSTNAILDAFRTAPTASIGDLYVVGAAIAYTFHCIRLEPYAQATSAVRLAACKATTEALWNVGSVLVFVMTYYVCGTPSPSLKDSGNALSQFALASGRDIVAYAELAWNGFLDLSRHGDTALVGTVLSSRIVPAAAAVLWTGWVTVAYTIYAQSYGQRRVRPVTANLIYTVQPVCTALVAGLVLGETLGPAGYAGGALIGTAVLLVATTTGPRTTNSKIQVADEKSTR